MKELKVVIRERKTTSGFVFSQRHHDVVRPHPIRDVVATEGRGGR